MTEKRQSIFDTPVLPFLSLLLSILGLFLEKPNDCYVMAINGMLIALLLWKAKDGTSVLLPVLSIIVCGVTHIPNVEDVIPFIPFGIPLLVALFYRLFTKKRKPYLGPSFYGLCVFALAELLGGVGCISLSDYFDYKSFLYLFGLTIGLILIYLVFSGEYRVTDISVSIDRFLACLFGIGILCCFIVWFNRFSPLAETDDYGIQLFYCKNTIANLLLMTMPSAGYFTVAGKNLPLRALSFFSLLLMYGCAIATASRGALLFGSILLVLLLIYIVINAEKKTDFLLFLPEALVVVAIALWLFGDTVGDILNERLQHGFIGVGTERLQLFSRSVSDFLSHPLFGIGLGSKANEDLYQAYACIGWYHLYFPQIWGSMGIVGIIAFFVQFATRLKSGLHRPDRQSVALLLSYLGLFLYSQTDPGEFIPIPFGGLAVVIFLLLDLRAKEEK